jgi:hypothetical protein
MEAPYLGDGEFSGDRMNGARLVQLSFANDQVSPRAEFRLRPPNIRRYWAEALASYASAE